MTPDLIAVLGMKVKRIVADSRRVEPGDAFAAYPGERLDGRKFIAQAVSAGAGAVLWEREGFTWQPEWRVPNLGIDRLRDKIGAIASQVYNEPSRQLWTIGITGTNGKTSCCHWVAQCLTALGKKTALVGTIGNGFPGALTPAANTTPDAVSLHGLLRDYLADGARCVAMEVSSHGLAQGRVNGMHFDVALLTNLSRDHLDYHGDMESYAAAKAGLFSWPELKYAVLNLDDPFGTELAGRLGCSGVQTVGYSLEGNRGDCRYAVLARDLVTDEQGIRFEAVTPWGCAAVNSALLGRFNAANLLGVLAVLLVSGIKLEDAVREVGRVGPVAGRLQRLGGDGKPLVVVDYAHTPDALEKVLGALREIMGGKGRLICVFGCGGERDRGKRPLMGEVSSRLADSVIVTSDNPRGEDPRDIIADIIAGMGANYHVNDDRAAAIDAAVRGARPHDVVLVAGKGHEDYQEIRGVRLPFSDAEVAQRVLEGYSTCCA
ncbi:MAG: UDP-N-acetylmuramoyl-L-alanyl-D-glutamate--2,6-diaminopimelate ligase [Gammaproteobacteria bacterium]|nr:UDP-N-acetylmuramoyl-L-alanyl-D-glutamate--2,6-diaminopimelate ligase [Gammaproteobacteria bacterium]